MSKIKNAKLEINVAALLCNLRTWLNADSMTHLTPTESFGQTGRHDRLAKHGHANTNEPYPKAQLRNLHQSC